MRLAIHYSQSCQLLDVSLPKGPGEPSPAAPQVDPSKAFPQKPAFGMQCHPERSHLDRCCPQELGHPVQECPGGEATGEGFSIQKDILGTRSITMC